MTFNIFIKTQTSSYNILNIDKEDLNVVINAYNNGKSDFFISGKRYWLSKLFEIRIFTFDHPDKFEEFIGLANNYGFFKKRPIGDPYLPPEILKEGGKEITKDFIKGDFGFLAHSANQRDNKFNMDIFISHSSDDSEIAKALIELIRKAFNISSKKITCTSVAGYKLKAGTNTDEQIKKVIFSSKAFIGLITSKSIHSTYVLFELGARWGADLPFIPLICDKAGISLLEGPIKNINTLSVVELSDIHQFLYDLGDILEIEPENPSGYLDDIQKLNVLVIGDREVKINEESQPEDEYNEAGEIIKKQSKIEWPDDYQMQLHYIETQKNAIGKLKKGKPDDLTVIEFKRIRERAAKDWPLNFEMRLHQEQTQIESLRKLKGIES